MIKHVTAATRMGRLGRVTLALMVFGGASIGLAAPATSGAQPAAASAASKPWVYKSPGHGYRLTLPSAAWGQPASKPRGSDAYFAHRTVMMHASVMAVRTQQTEADLAAAVERARTLLESAPARRATAKFRTGTNTAGNHYRYFTAIDSPGSGEQRRPVFLGNSFTWNPTTHVLIILLFEGVMNASSDSDRAVERDALEKESEAICLSVE